MATAKTSAKKPLKKSTPQKKSALPQNPEDDKSALRKLFIDEIKDIYWAEKHLTKALPKMQKAASSAKLKKAIGTHLDQTHVHVERLEQVFELLAEPIRAKKCDAMEGLVMEGEGVIEDTDAGTATRDVGIIIASQKVEHYEIAAYGGLTQLANVLQLKDVAKLLTQTLEEEKETDALLSDLAENDINYNATLED